MNSIERQRALDFFDYMARIPRGPIKNLKALSQGEMAIMQYLNESQGTVMPTMISDYLHLSTARVANALKSLEKKRYIHRSHDMQDRRRVTVSLTPLGKQIAQENLDDTLEKINELMHDMGDQDADEFIRLMKKMCHLFDEKKPPLP